MLCLTLLLLSPAHPGPGPAQEPRAAADLAYCEVVPDRPVVWLGQELRVAFRFGVEESLRSERLVPLFRRELDLQLQLQAPWVSDLPGAIALEPGGRAEQPAEALTFALESGEAFARRVPVGGAGREGFASYEFTRDYLPERAGQLTLPPAVLRYAYASGFEEDLLGVLVPVDRREGRVESEPRSVRVQALPEEGRPAGFTGAIGSLDVRGEVVPVRLRVGDVMTWTLRISGSTNLDRFELPRITPEGFRVQSIEDDRAAAGDLRTVRVELCPTTHLVRELPPFSIDWFDPPSRYRTTSTEPVPLAVTAPEAEAEAEAGAEPAPASSGPPTSSGALVRRSWVLLGGGAGGLLLAFFLLLRARRAGSDPADELRRRRLLVEALRERLDGLPEEGPGSALELEQALVDLAAGLTGSTRAGVIGPELASRLADSGVADAPARELAVLIDELVAARFGEQEVTAARTRASSLVRAIERGQEHA